MDWIKRTKVITLSLSMAIVLTHITGCATQASGPPNLAKPAKHAAVIGEAAKLSSAPSYKAAKPMSTAPQRIDAHAGLVNNNITNIQAGTGQYLAKKRLPQKKQLKAGEKGIELNFSNLDLHAFVKAILGDALGYRYSIDPDVTGRVSIHTTNPLPKTELIDLLQETLSLNGATMMVKNDYYRIVPLTKAAQMPLVPRVKRLRDQGYGLQIVPLRFIGAAQMLKIIQPVIKNEGVAYAVKRHNVLMLSGDEAMVSNIIDLIHIFDVDWLAGKSVSLFALRHVAPKALVLELEAALDGENGELFDGTVRVISIARINSLLVISHSRQYLKKISHWISRLDVSNDKAENRLYVYRLQNTKAVDMANTLSKIFVNKATNRGQGQPALLAPNRQEESIASTDLTLSQSLAQQQRLTGGDHGVVIADQSSLKIIASPENNALLIMGTSRDYEMVESAIKQLDILPKQVLIEATIIEVNLKGDLNYGVEWFFNNTVDGKVGRGQLSLGSDGISRIAPGFSYGVVNSAGALQVVLNALESKTNVRVLSSPSIMVLDNKSATINVGDEIPVPTRQSNSNTDPNAPTVNEIEYRSTGILLTVSPRINAGGLVTLDITQEVSDAIATNTSGLDAPTIQQRTIQSTVAIQNNQSVILGGLIRNVKETTKSGVPFISRIPIIGSLFSQNSNGDRRTELMIIITPRVISDSTEAQRITDEYREKLARPL